MAWEKRNKGRYYYRSQRVGGRVVKQYFGADRIGLLAADVDAEARARRADDAEALRVEQSHRATLDRPLDVLDGACDVLVAATLTAAGYHRRNYGP